jgi:hypothetical protein
MVVPVASAPASKQRITRWRKGTSSSIVSARTM